MKIAVINGPNLNLLGRREPHIYGNDTLADIERMIRDEFEGAGVDLRFEQSNSEGELIDFVQAAELEWGCAGMIINPGAYSHYSYALGDAFDSLSIPIIEVHLSNTAARDEFRRRSVTAAGAIGKIEGLGWRGYVAAIRFLLERSA